MVGNGESVGIVGIGGAVGIELFTELTVEDAVSAASFI